MASTTSSAGRSVWWRRNDQLKPLCLGDKRVAVACEPLLIAFAQIFGASGDHAVPAFARGEFGAALVGQSLLGGIEDLHEMAAHALRRDCFDTLGRFLHGLEEIAEQEAFGEAAQSCRRRQARRLAGIAHQNLGDPARGAAAGVRPAAEHADALAATGEKLG